MANSIQDALNRASTKDKQTIEAAKSHITSIENADKATPQTTPSQTPANTKEQQLPEDTRASIENTQRSPGNNYLHQKENAIDRAQDRPSKEPQKPEREPEKEH